MKIDLNNVDQKPPSTEDKKRKSRLQDALSDTKKLEGMHDAKFQSKSDIDRANENARRAAERMTERVQSKLKPWEKELYRELLDGRSESAHTRKLILLYLQNPDILDMLEDDFVNQKT